MNENSKDFSLHDDQIVVNEGYIFEFLRSARQMPQRFELTSGRMDSIEKIYKDSINVQNRKEDKENGMKSHNNLSEQDENEEEIQRFLKDDK